MTELDIKNLKHVFTIALKEHAGNREELKELLKLEEKINGNNNKPNKSTKSNKR